MVTGHPLSQGHPGTPRYRDTQGHTSCPEALCRATSPHPLFWGQQFPGQIPLAESQQLWDTFQPGLSSPSLVSLT